MVNRAAMASTYNCLQEVAKQLNSEDRQYVVSQHVDNITVQPTNRSLELMVVFINEDIDCHLNAGNVYADTMDVFSLRASPAGNNRTQYIAEEVKTDALFGEFEPFFAALDKLYNFPLRENVRKVIHELEDLVAHRKKVWLEYDPYNL